MSQPTRAGQSLPKTRSGEAATLPTGSPGAEYFRSLIRGMRCGIVSTDRDGRLVLANLHARQILEMNDPRAEGAPVERALHDHPQIARVLRDAFTMSSLPNRAEIVLRCPRGGEKTIGFTLSLVPGEDGTAAGAAMFFKDLTHVEHREEQERLKDRLAALGQMSANLAHEIRNPLASIEVSCSLLKRRLDRESDGGALLEKIIDEVRRLDRTITSSLEYVRPVSPTLAPCRIEPVIDEAVRVAQGRGGGAGVRVLQSFEPTLPAFLMDRGQIRQVLENLALNALEAMNGEGVLTVETARMPAPVPPSTPYRPEGAAEDPWTSFDAYAVIRVGDTGPGIPEEHLDRLFYPFFTTKKRGSGVGLAMAKKIVDGHRGLIDVASRPGEGATFTIRLPLVRQIREDRNS